MPSTCQSGKEESNQVSSIHLPYPVITQIGREDMGQEDIQIESTCPGAHREDLHNIIGCGAHRVYILLAQYPHKAHTIRLQDPFLQGLEFSIFCDDDLLLVVCLR